MHLIPCKTQGTTCQPLAPGMERAKRPGQVIGGWTHVGGGGATCLSVAAAVGFVKNLRMPVLAATRVCSLRAGSNCAQCMTERSRRHWHLCNGRMMLHLG